MHPGSLITYYPQYSILDEFTSDPKVDEIIIYVDIRNCLKSIYMEEVIHDLVESTNKYKKIDTSIISSLLSFISFHKKYAKKRGKKITTILFFETGRSYYHENINSKYKSTRKIGSLFTLNEIDRDLFFNIIRRNLMFSERLFNGFPDVHVVKLENFEADFIPYYMIKNNVLVDETKGYVHVTYSGDKDLMQISSLKLNNGESVVYNRNKKPGIILRDEDVMSNYFKTNVDFPSVYLPLVMSILGDKVDDVDKIEKIGPKTCIKFLPELIDFVGDMNVIYDRIKNKENIFDEYLGENKYIKKIIHTERESKLISNNLRQISFEIISRYFDNPDKTEILDKRKKFYNIFEKKKIYEHPERVLNSIRKLDVYMDDEDVFWDAWG